MSLTPAATTAYLPIKDFGLIGDLHTAALVSKNGSIDWCCWPDFDSPAVFCKLLDAKLGGSFAISPHANFVSSQSYIDGTNVLQTKFETDSGTIRLNDFMPVGRLLGNYKERPPLTRRAISRLIEGVSGEVEIEINFRPTFDYARAKTEVEVFASGGVARAGNEAVVLYCPFELRATADGRLHCTVKIQQGDRVWLHLSYRGQSTIDLHDLSPAAHEAELEQAIAHWRESGKQRERGYTLSLPWGLMSADRGHMDHVKRMSGGPSPLNPPLIMPYGYCMGGQTHNRILITGVIPGIRKYTYKH